MILEDPIYGKFDINDEIILTLLENKAVLRLKELNQSGLIAYINGYNEFSRYDHSIGCMLLLRHLGATVEEQVAALLHDVSHTAFSYVIDTVFSDSLTRNYHDYFRERIMFWSEIPELLTQANIDTGYVLNKHNFILLERKTPTMCADRVDYALRTLWYYFNKQNVVKRYFDQLINFNGEMVFRDREVAAEFAYDYLHLDSTVYNNYRNQSAFYLLSDAIKLALASENISEDDFLLSDVALWDKLTAIKDDTVSVLMSAINPNLKAYIDNNYFDYAIYTRPRYIN
ncbi:MAG: hypothetical protein M3P33_03540, partial [bacterium]|nr:hypothetical protein [bacterium]